MNCPRCQSADATEKSVDERYQYTCKKCGKRWYSSRSWTNGPYTILDGIADSIAEHGAADAMVVILLNAVWREKFWDCLQAWCENHGFRYDVVDLKALGKKTFEQHLRIGWRV
jgi:hypothetical protein